MASGSSGRTGSGSKGFDFVSDDILSNYDDFGYQETSNGKHTDPMTADSFGKDYGESRMGRPALQVYNQQEGSLNQHMVSSVEKTVKKYSDNLLRFLEGISGRLSKLELYCYNLDRTVGEMRSDLVHNHNEADSKLKSLEKHLQEVHKNVQILKDKQELAETQKKLENLQLPKKESSPANHQPHIEERVAPSGPDPKRPDSHPEVQNPQLALALALPQQVTQSQAYYPSQNPQSQIHHHPQNPYLQSDSQYQTPPQLPDLPRQAPQPPQPQVIQTQQVPSFSSYQQWPQQFPPQVPLQQTSLQTHRVPQKAPVYPPYPSNQPTKPSPDTFPVLSGGIPSGITHTEPMTYVYSAPLRNPPLQPQPETNQSSYGSYAAPGSHLAQSPGAGYIMYNAEGVRAGPPQPSHFAQPQGIYPPAHVSSLQNSQPTSGGLLVRHSSPPQMIISHQYRDMVEQAGSMGYTRDHVVSVIRRMEESGQVVDFNSVLDRLNNSSGGSQIGWSG